MVKVFVFITVNKLVRTLYLAQAFKWQVTYNKIPDRLKQRIHVENNKPLV